MADYQQPIGEYMPMMLCDSESDNEAMDDNLEEEDDEENVQNYELEDDDFIVDQENTIHDVDVDMADFRLNVDSDMERDDVLNGFPVDDEPEDMEVINYEDWESLDEGSDQDSKRRALIKSLGKPRKCSLGEIHKILDQVEANPVVPLRALQDHIQKKYEVGVSMDKVYRAKDKAKQLVVGDYTKQYELLRDYVLELQATNADTTVNNGMFFGTGYIKFLLLKTVAKCKQFLQIWSLNAND
ncbi:hypothetical protein LXL04_035677 [Taraxacum kok-saghyz]